MAVRAMVVGVLAVLLGMAGSFHWDTPAGPSIVVAALGLFALALAAASLVPLIVPVLLGRRR